MKYSTPEEIQKIVDDKQMYFPVVIISDLESASLGKGIKLRGIKEKELKEWFQIKDRKIKDNNSMTFKEVNHKSFGSRIIDPSLEIELLRSNFVIHLNNQDDQRNVNQALRLIKLGNSGFCIGFGKGKRTSFSPAALCSHFVPTAINKLDLPQLRKLIRKLKENKDDKIKLAVERYCCATSSIKFPLSNRFLDLMIVLEMLYLPHGDQELSYKLALRVGKLFNQEFKCDTRQIFQKIKKGKNSFYTIRSKIVHSGNSKELNKDVFIELTEIVRKSLVLALFKPNKFTDEYLELIALK